MDDRQPQPLEEPLSEREVEILRLLADGLSNREIAQELFLSPETVKWYNKQLYAKLSAGNRTQAVARAREHGLLDGQGTPSRAVPERLRHNLPAQLTSFVGRQRELAEVRDLLSDTRLLTLTGPGGTGKTRLAVQAASEMVNAFTDGVYYVDLAPVSQPDLVPATVCSILGCKESAELSVLDLLTRHLQSRHLLLLLDNFEHLLESAALFGDLLESAPDLSVLATSREPLQLYGEHAYPVPPLSLPDLDDLPSPQDLMAYEAIALFVQRAQAVLPDFELTAENAPAVAEICVRLDGLPLAIELATARSRLFGPQALLGQLESRLDTLESGPRGLPERQRTLRGAIAWSTDLLDEAEQTLFARLSVFQGGTSIGAAAAVCDHDLSIDVLDGLESLLNKSLLRQRPDPEGEPRFFMLETIHEFARETLEQQGERHDLQARHAATFVEYVEEAEAHTRAGARQLLWLNRLEADHDNVRAALRWAFGDSGDLEMGLRLVGALGHFWYRQGHYGEGHRWTSEALVAESGQETPPAVRAALFASAGLVAFYRLEQNVGKRLHLEALKIYQELGDRRNEGWARLWVAVQCFGDADAYQEALSLCEEGIRILSELDDWAGVGQALNVLGELARLQKDYERARAAYEECIQIARQIDDKLREVMQIGNLAYLDTYAGDAAGAASKFQRALSMSMDTDNLPAVIYYLASTAGALAAIGQPERAARILGASDAHYEARGFTPQPSDIPDLERDRAAIRAQLDEAAFEAAYGEGRAMSLEQAVAYALES